MYYNKFCGEQVSALGFGAMRLPTCNGAIDIENSRRLLEYAYASGINYFDTGYRYLEGQSEVVLGNVLKQYPRHTWKIATKMPGHMILKKGGKITFRGYMRNEEPRSISDIFAEQLNKCGVEYFDFYLLHNLNDLSFGIYTDDELGIVDYLLKQKKEGKIKHLGFSTHGSVVTIKNFLDMYPGVFEFVQIQLNYFDWFCGDAKEQYDLITTYNLPMVIMEPCRGGVLANIDYNIAASLRKMAPSRTNAGWAFRFVQGLENVSVVLSGMSDMQQIEDNLNTFNQPCVLNDDEKNVLEEIAYKLKRMVLCTGCSYCCETCPAKIDIPGLIEIYNKYISGEINSVASGYIAEAEKCLNCLLCEKACPQQLKPNYILKELIRLSTEEKDSGEYNLKWK